jgi:hypothetical protein
MQTISPAVAGDIEDGRKLRLNPGGGLLLLALLCTLFNSLKPLHIDDGIYHAYAAQVAAHPLDPYGFQISPGVPANHTLAPPLLPYWWALAIRLFGEQPFLWKLWLLPFSLLLVFSLHALLRRFAGGLEAPLTWMAALSPAVLPGWNLMLDVPALALAFGALTLFFRACDRSSWSLAALAGLAAGLAIETKYTALVAPAVILLYATCFRRVALGLVAVIPAVVVFTAWESFTALRYGESHFLYSLHQRDGHFWIRIVHLAFPLLGMLGGIAPALGLLGLVALGAHRKVVVTAALLIGGGYLVVALVPEPYATFLRDPATGKARLTLNNVVFGASGATVVGIALAVVGRLCHREPGGRVTGVPGPGLRQEWFLVLWLGLELGGYFVLSPFPAVRRVLGVVTVLALVAGCLAARTCRAPARGRLVCGTALVGVLLGLCFYALDLREAFAAKAAAAQTARWIRDRDPHATIWSLGDHGFAFYADRAGMRNGPHPGPIRPGDWLVLGLGEELPGRGRFQAMTNITVDDCCSLQTTPVYYAGRTALEHRCGPRYSCAVYRCR